MADDPIAATEGGLPEKWVKHRPGSDVERVMELDEIPGKAGAIFTIWVGPSERSSMHVRADSEADPARVLRLALLTLEAEARALKGCPAHSATRTPSPCSLDEDVVERVASAIHVARFDTPGARPVEPMGLSDHEYCGRLARAALSALRPVQEKNIPVVNRDEEGD